MFLLVSKFKNDKNATERCARESDPKKETKKLIKRRVL